MMLVDVSAATAEQCLAEIRCDVFRLLVLITGLT